MEYIFHLKIYWTGGRQEEILLSTKNPPLPLQEMLPIVFMAAHPMIPPTILNFFPIKLEGKNIFGIAEQEDNFLIFPKNPNINLKSGEKYFPIMSTQN